MDVKRPLDWEEDALWLKEMAASLSRAERDKYGTVKMTDFLAKIMAARLVLTAARLEGSAGDAAAAAEYLAHLEANPEPEMGEPKPFALKQRIPGVPF